MIKRILIANRGEIAIRIIRTCRLLGIETVLAHSACDKDSLGVFLADKTVCVGGIDAYLGGDAIINAAFVCGCDAVHPGYGFLSEDASFAKKVVDAGLIFIGPKYPVLKRCSNKKQAKKLAQRCNVPVVPMAKVSDEYPLLLKSCSGGGGKGIRLLNSRLEYESAINEAKNELKDSFNESDFYLEKNIDKYKHIDIQFLSDGESVTVFPPRDCSVQHSYQKDIEGSPVAKLPRKLIKTLQESTRAIVTEAKYDGVGTVEFLIDHKMDYYFLEINSRLQVEHTVTEEITGVDFVAEQIRLANGLKNDLSDAVRPRGHAIECRIVAREAGDVAIYNLPSGPGVRVDSYIYQGYEVKPYYDALLMKIITSGKSREVALKRMKMALSEMMLGGIKTNLEDIEGIVNSESFNLAEQSIFE